MSPWRPRSAPSRASTALLLALALVCPGGAEAKPTPWCFDFNASVSKSPSYVTKQLQSLSTGLPGLPSSGIDEVTSGQVKLYFFDDVADALKRAKSSGPPVLPALVRKPVLCTKHAAFAKPTLLVGSPSSACQSTEKAAMAAFDSQKLQTCSHVEFPESYVYEHSPVGYVDLTTVSTLEKLISFAGEALTHVDYPTGLLPADFISTTRKVIARLRYQPLKQELADRVKAYKAALAQLQASSSCFDKTALAAFSTTVTGLVAELGAVEQDLDATYKAGVAQAAKDLQAIQAQGRKRATLPFPALTDRDRELLALYLGGIYWRMRGAGLIAVPPDPQQGLLRRWLYTYYPYQLIAELAGGKADAAGVGLNIFIQENWGWGDWFDMGTNPSGNDKYADLVDMTIRGKVQTSLAAPPLKQRGFDIRPLVAGGLQMGPCYFYTWEEIPKFKLGEKLTSPYMHFLEWPTSSGEFCAGAALALGLTRTLLWGKPCTKSCAGKPCGAPDGCGGACGGPGCPDAAVPDGPPADLPKTDHPGGDLSLADLTLADLASDGRAGAGDGAPRLDGPSPPGPAGSPGCSCRLVGGERSQGDGPVLVLALLLLVRRTRRR